MAEIQRGVVKWFNDAKGFGFIEHESGRDVFVHYSVIESEGFKTLKDGEPVHYELKEGEKGLHAARVVRVNEGEVSQPSEQYKDTGESDSDDRSMLTAPNLQQGNVEEITRGVSSMIEVEVTRNPERSVAGNEADDEQSSELTNVASH